jgi:chromate transporter
LNRKIALLELCGLFFKLGTLAFGGPAVHIAMMEEEVVRRRRWLTREQFLDYLGATNLIPGPNSTELAIHIGHARAGMAGLIVAGTSFIFPAAVIVGVIAWLYVKFGALPQVSGILYGVKPVVIAVIAQAVWQLTRSAVKSRWLALIGVAAVVFTAAGVNELAVLAGGGLLAVGGGVLASRRLSFVPGMALYGAPVLSGAAPSMAAAVGAAVIPFSFSSLFLVFAKIGSVLFGSGYVLVAFLRSELVERMGWITQKQLLDAVAVGQVTPGPVFTTATFVGYVLGGFQGAVIATLGIFLPAFFFVAISAPFLPRLRRSPIAGALLDGVNVSSLALMGVVTFQLARTAVSDWITLALAVTSAVLLIRFRLNSVWLVTAGAIIGTAAVLLRA